MKLRTESSTPSRESADRRRPTRTLAALSIVLCGAALLLGSSLGTGTAGATGTITVVQTPIPNDGDCNPLGRLQWTYTTESTSEFFKLTVVNPTNLCDPVDAVAAIYAMPTDGSVWPQTLSSTEDFTISTASVTTITFSKDCDPAQFDVLTGDTPPVIAPTGPYHGPLLFPTDVATAEQYNGCVEPTSSTTSSTSSTTSSTSSTTSTTQPEVAGITTIQTGPSTSAPGTQSANVAGISQSAADPASASLALTGAPSGDLAVLGGLLLLAGLGLLAWNRRGRPGTE